MKTLGELRKETNLIIERTAKDGGLGVIILPDSGNSSVIWSNGGGWEHVSVAPFKRHKVPTWKDMCFLKRKFFRSDEMVVEYHPAEGSYVNNMENCLHLWRPIKTQMPCPPTIMVGIRDGQTVESFKKEVNDVLGGEE